MSISCSDGILCCLASLLADETVLFIRSKPDGVNSGADVRSASDALLAIEAPAFCAARLALSSALPIDGKERMRLRVLGRVR